MQVLLDDDLGRLTLRRLRPWHRLLACCLAARLDRQLADDARPESSAILAARALRLTSMRFRRDLAASLRRVLTAAGGSSPGPRALTGVVRVPPTTAAGSAGVARPPWVSVRRAWIGQLSAELAELAGHLAAPDPVPARGVAMVTRLLADGTGPLYHEGSRDDLHAIVEQAAEALTH